MFKFLIGKLKSRFAAKKAEANKRIKKAGFEISKTMKANAERITTKKQEPVGDYCNACGEHLELCLCVKTV